MFMKLYPVDIYTANTHSKYFINMICIESQKHFKFPGTTANRDHKAQIFPP